MATISYLTRIEFDFGLAAKLPDFCAELGMTCPLLVTDAGLTALGVTSRIAEGFAQRPQVFDGTPANPTEAAVMEALAVYRESSCDGILALGGGSSLDLGKAVRLLVSHEPPLSQYAAVEGGVAPIKGSLPPLIAVPTTAGTGSEVGRGAVIVMNNGRKLGVVSPLMLPSLAVCDPELTLGLPPILTAATGMDALAHCLETFMSPAVNPPADAIALEGLVRGYGAIRTAVANGGNRNARWDMLMASMEGAMAFQKGLGAVHSLSHPLGALADLKLHHGTLNAVLLPAVLRFNQPAIGEKWERLSAVLGGAPDQKIAALNSELGLPASLSQMGVAEEQLAAVAAAALLDHCHGTNPRIASEEEYRSLLREAF
ncbi:iron-containing alcohol dehydrogenase [Pelagibius sp. Alg239-R121]|uniref:iron-containing alcohol dehydrogenase n=1 Tax=Pelagibius sp. Alg239-R121 TaxID=2993448 RepID=UPI0024A71C53|nr:iron-containing alcohol dehydrogenase [Pelagibius sp. Alg239-R121]